MEVCIAVCCASEHILLSCQAHIQIPYNLSEIHNVLYRSKRKVRQVSDGVYVLVYLIQLSWSEWTCTSSEICQKWTILRNGYVKIRWGGDRQNLHDILQEFAQDEKYFHSALYLPLFVSHF